MPKVFAKRNQLKTIPVCATLNGIGSRRELCKYLQENYYEISPIAYYSCIVPSFYIVCSLNILPLKSIMFFENFCFNLFMVINVIIICFRLSTSMKVILRT